MNLIPWCHCNIVVVSCRVVSCRVGRVVCVWHLLGCLHAYCLTESILDACACVCECFRFLTPTVYCCTARACGNIWFGSTNWTTTAHTNTYTHIGPGPCVEARDAARPGRARRGGCGQLLRRAAETPEHLAQVVVPGRKSEFGQNLAPKAALLIGEECPGPGAKLHGHAIPPPAPVKAKLKIRKRGLPFWEMGLKIQVQVLKTWLCLDEGTGASGGEGGGGGRTKSNAAMLLFMPPVPPGSGADRTPRNPARKTDFRPGGTIDKQSLCTGPSEPSCMPCDPPVPKLIHV